MGEKTGLLKQDKQNRNACAKRPEFQWLSIANTAKTNMTMAFGVFVACRKTQPSTGLLLLFCVVPVASWENRGGGQAGHSYVNGCIFIHTRHQGPTVSLLALA